MKYLLIIIAIASLNVFSCRTVNNSGNTRSENSTVENTSIIRGTVRIYGNAPNTFVGIRDERGTEYAVYPASKENELRALQGNLIDFTVMFVNERSYGSLFLQGGTVTPIEWKIIQ